MIDGHAGADLNGRDRAAGGGPCRRPRFRWRRRWVIGQLEGLPADVHQHRACGDGWGGGAGHAECWIELRGDELHAGRECCVSGGGSVAEFVDSRRTDDCDVAGGGESGVWFDL